jgi:rubrerythrin
MEENLTTADESVEPGESVYTETGRFLGRIAGITDDGFEVETVETSARDGVDQEELPGQEFGEGYLMWQCGECGEMGELDESIPESCPSCDAPREAISEVRED